MTIAVTSGYTAVITGEAAGSAVELAPAVTGKKPFIKGWSLRESANSAAGKIELGFNSASMDVHALIDWPIDGTLAATGFDQQPMTPWTNPANCYLEGTPGQNIAIRITGASGVVSGTVWYGYS